MVRPCCGAGQDITEPLHVLSCSIVPHPVSHLYTSMHKSPACGGISEALKDEQIHAFRPRMAREILLGLRRCHYAGLATNLVIYLQTVMGESSASAAIQQMMFEGTCYLTPLLGAVLADSRWGRYKTILVFSAIYFVVSRCPGPCYIPTQALAESLPSLIHCFCSSILQALLTHAACSRPAVQRQWQWQWQWHDAPIPVHATPTQNPLMGKACRGSYV